MKVTGATEAHIRRAAHTAGVRVSGLRPDGAGFRFTIKTDSARFGYGKAPYRRLSRFTYGNGKYRTVPGRVCWHGFREFFFNLFDRVPSAVAETSMATYKGDADFLKSHGATIRPHSGRPWENKNAGFAPSEYDPARDLCTCGNQRKENQWKR